MQYKNIHFIGIGGIGMSALARYFKYHGSHVTGSDLEDADLISDLRKEGIGVALEQVAANIKDETDCIVYTVAVPDDNPELAEARDRGLPIFTYAEMLGEVSKNSFTIAVAGTHGKTTTTAMTGAALQGADVHPNIIVGSLLAETGSNFVPGEGEDKNIFVVEACEYARSFLNLHPDILVITNIEEDHLDYYKDLAEIQETFLEMASKVPENGKIVCDIHQPHLAPVVQKFPEKVVDYSEFINEVPEMIVFGDHNIQNAAATLAVVSSMGKDIVGAKNGLGKFKGTWRRLEFKKELQNGALLFDDYGHHPDEITATLDALKNEYPEKKIMTLFQPHLYSRTKTFLKEFSEILATKSDRVITYPIYAAREKDDGTISSEILTEEINQKGGDSKHFDTYEDISKEVSVLDENWVVLILGAGDLYTIAKDLA